MIYIYMVRHVNTMYSKSDARGIYRLKGILFVVCMTFSGVYIYIYTSWEDGGGDWGGGGLHIVMIPITLHFDHQKCSGCYDQTVGQIVREEEGGGKGLHIVKRGV